MNRLQKKCVIGTAGLHLLLLVVIVVVGSGFFNPKPKPNDDVVLTMIPSILVDADANSGVRNAQPPPPLPQPRPQPQPQPQPVKAVEPPKPAPQPKPEPTMMEKFEKIFKSEPVKPAPEKPDDHKIQPNLKKTVRTSAKPVPNPAVAKAIRDLQKKFSKPVEIAPVGTSTVAYANYANVVRNVYDAAWTLPGDIGSEDVNVKVSVTIASDGTVISSKIVTESGDNAVDDSVQKALDRVQNIAPFPEGSTDKERSYVINFNTQLKKSE
jgi:TonB family protein